MGNTIYKVAGFLLIITAIILIIVNIYGAVTNLSSDNWRIRKNYIDDVKIAVPIYGVAIILSIILGTYYFKISNKQIKLNKKIFNSAIFQIIAVIVFWFGILFTLFYCRDDTFGMCYLGLYLSTFILTGIIWTTAIILLIVGKRKSKKEQVNTIQK